MTLYYRETDAVSGRWTGNTSGADLSAAQIDEIVWTLDSRITATQAMITSARSIATITLSANELTFHMTDSSLEGPFPIPIGKLRGRGAFSAPTNYSDNDTFYINGTVYIVNYPHLSASPFDAGANDGMGHSYYEVMVPNPGNALPTGGAAHAALRKSTGADYAVTWGFQPASETPFTPSTGSTLTSGFVDEALEEVEARIAAKSLASLTDVELGSPSVGDVLIYVSDTGGNNWQNVPQSSLSIAFTQITGTATAAQLPFPTPTTIGGVESLAAVAHNFLTQIGTDGTVLQAQPAFSDLSGTISAGQRDPTVTALGTTGTVSLDPTLGDVFSITPTGNVTLNAASAPANAKITVIVTTSGTSSFNITPTTNFKSTGALATGTVTAKTFSISFVGNGSNLVETSRTAAM